MSKGKEIKKAKSAVITIGEGRGFVVNGRAYFARGNPIAQNPEST
jgi:hypothetical protein